MLSTDDEDPKLDVAQLHRLIGEKDAEIREL